MSERAKIEFSENVSDGIKRLIEAAEMACTAFEMLRPENHEAISDSEIAALISGADEAMHEAVAQLAGRKLDG